MALSKIRGLDGNCKFPENKVDYLLIMTRELERTMPSMSFCFSSLCIYFRQEILKKWEVHELPKLHDVVTLLQSNFFLDSSRQIF